MEVSGIILPDMLQGGDIGWSARLARCWKPPRASRAANAPVPRMLRDLLQSSTACGGEPVDGSRVFAAIGSIDLRSGRRPLGLAGPVSEFR